MLFMFLTRDFNLWDLSMASERAKMTDKLRAPSTQVASSTRTANSSCLWKCVNGIGCWPGLPSSPLEHIFSVETFPIWRLHVIWSKKSGEDLRTHLIQRFASSVVFLSLMLGTEIGVLFSPSTPANDVRIKMKDKDYGSLEYWAGIVLCLAVLWTISALIATFTAWAVTSVVSGTNAHLIFRSTLGIYAAQLPSNLILVSIYFFFLWVVLFYFKLLPLLFAIMLVSLGTYMLFHIISTYSALARIIIHTGAMGEEQILSISDQESRDPSQIMDSLVEKTTRARSLNIPVSKQYRTKYQQSISNLNVIDVSDEEKQEEEKEAYDEEKNA